MKEQIYKFLESLEDISLLSTSLSPAQEDLVKDKDFKTIIKQQKPILNEFLKEAKRLNNKTIDWRYLVAEVYYENLSNIDQLGLDSSDLKTIHNDLKTLFP